MKRSLRLGSMVLGLMVLASCRSEPAPTSGSSESPVQFHLLIDAPRVTELIGDDTLDVSSIGPFVTRNLNGRIYDNNMSGTDGDPGSCPLSVRVGSQACRTAPLVHDEISIRLRHHTGAPLTVTECRDLAGIVEARPWNYSHLKYNLVYSRVEPDGHACVYYVDNNNS